MNQEMFKKLKFVKVVATWLSIHYYIQKYGAKSFRQRTHKFRDNSSSETVYQKAIFIKYDEEFPSQCSSLITHLAAFYAIVFKYIYMH